MSPALALLCGMACGAAAFVAPSDTEMARHLSGHGAVLADRLLAVTSPLVGAPYVRSPLGEGPGAEPDPDPRMRFDAFDCTTFVETAMALALARDLDEARALLDVLRYKGGLPGWLARRHFPEAEWIPELVRLGFLEDVTRRVGGDDVVLERKALDVTVWRQNRNKVVPDLPEARIPRGVFALEVWPLAVARQRAARIPAGTLLHLVRADFRSVPVRVSHQGIVLEKDGVKILRHAADRMHHAVVDEPLERFFARMAQYTRWPVVGVHLTAVREPEGWRTLLPQGPTATRTSEPDERSVLAAPDAP